MLLVYMGVVNGWDIMIWDVTLNDKDYENQSDLASCVLCILG